MDRLQSVHGQIHRHLEEMAKLFTKGCKLTFIMRRPDNAECFIICGDDDDIEAVVDTLRRRPARTFGGVAAGIAEADAV